jgi:predicted RNA-binding protein
MAKSLGEYVIEKLSSSDILNIKWTHKNPKDIEKSKKKKSTKKFPNSLASNIIYTQKTKKTESHVSKIFKIVEVIDTEKSKKKIDKKYKNSSASNCNIKPEFKRPAR